MTSRSLAWSALLVVQPALCACSGANYECESSRDCVDSAERAGTCEREHSCSFPDLACASGRRFASHSGGHSDRCVPSDREFRFLDSVSVAAEDVAELDLALQDLEQAPDGFALLLASTKPFASASAAADGTEWTRVAEQCSARQTTGVSVWLARSEELQEAVTITWPDAVEGVAMAASFTGPAWPHAIDVGSANTGGQSATCDSGVDSRQFTIELSNWEGLPILLAAVAPRSTNVIPETDAVVVASARSESDSGGPPSVNLIEFNDESADDDRLSGDLSSEIDWSAVALGIR